MTIAEPTASGSFSHVEAAQQTAALIAALDEPASVPAIQRLQASTAEVLRPRLGDRLLDVGCGTGPTTAATPPPDHLGSIRPSPPDQD